MMKTASIHQAKLLFSLLLVFAFIDHALACCSVTDKCTDELGGEEKDDAEECTDGGGDAVTDELYVDRMCPFSKNCVCCIPGCTAVKEGCDTAFGDKVIRTITGGTCAADEQYEYGTDYAVLGDGTAGDCGCCKICKITDECTEADGVRAIAGECTEEKTSYIGEGDENYIEGVATCSCCLECVVREVTCPRPYVDDGFYKCEGFLSSIPHLNGNDECRCCAKDLEEK